MSRSNAVEAHKQYYLDYIMRAINKFDIPMEFAKWLFAPAQGAAGREGGAE